MITVQGISKSFGDVQAVRDVSFTIARGEVVGLLGPNGAGKSTTMRLLTGYLTADRGDIIIDDIPVAMDPLAARARIGYLPENAPLYTDMEVSDFLAHIASLRGVPANARTERIRAMVRQCGLRDVVGRPIDELSKGFRQRVGLAAAMIHEPPVLILDEPTTGLDPNQLADMRDVIREIGKARTILLSTHIMQEVEAVCSRAIIINKGCVVGVGSLDELTTAESGSVRYHALINASENILRERLATLPGTSLLACRAVAHDNWNAVVMQSSRGLEGDAIFSWVVQNGWKLRELTRDAANLESVFHDLTRN